VAVLLGVIVALLAAQDHRERLAEGRFPEALVAADRLEGIEVARARVEVLFTAGDLRGALCEALAENVRDDLVVSWRATQIGLSLGHGDVAREGLARLRAGLASAAAPAEERSWWETEVARLAGDLEVLARREDQRRSALQRARATAIALLLLAGTLAAFLVTRADKARARPAGGRRDGR